MQALYSELLKRLEDWGGNYEKTARPRDISKLEGIQKLLRDLDLAHPEQDASIIHIAGTNGKGLTATMLEKLLQLESQTTGCFTSPHLYDIRERIALNGVPVSQKNFVIHATRVLNQAESYAGTPYLSYFDLLTAVAFSVFQEAQVDWILLETGLGGRADSTNVVSKTLAILTAIGHDHQHILGNKLKEIAQEKLGIVSQNAPVILSSQIPSLKNWLLQEAQKISLNVISAEELQIRRKEQCYIFTWQDGVKYEIIDCDLLPAPRLECMRTTLLAAQTLFFAEKEQRKSWTHALFQVQLPGRLDRRQNLIWKAPQKVSEQKRAGFEAVLFQEIIFDGGHNPEALFALAYQLQLWKVTSYVLILGLASDKKTDLLAESLTQIGLQAQKVILTQADSARAMSPVELASWLQPLLSSKTEVVLCSNSVEAMLHVAQTPQDPLVVAGSFYLVGEILKSFQDETVL